MFRLVPVLAVLTSALWAPLGSDPPTSISIRDLVGLGGVPLIIALVELAKRAAPAIPSRWYPVLALIAGIAVNLTLRSISGLSVTDAIFLGIIAALAASGLYSQSRAAGTADPTDPEHAG